MVNETLSREEHVTELALHRNGMLEHSLIDLDIVHFLSQLLISILDLSYCLWKALVGLHQLICSLLLILQHDFCLLVLLLILNGLHQGLLHVHHFFLLLLLTQLHLTSHLLLLLLPKLILYSFSILLLQLLDLLLLLFDLIFIFHPQLLHLKTLIVFELQLHFFYRRIVLTDEALLVPLSLSQPLSQILNCWLTGFKLITHAFHVLFHKEDTLFLQSLAFLALFVFVSIFGLDLL